MAEYRVERSIGRGGMGQVLLAVQRGAGGFEKLVVLKRLHPEQLEDEAALAMFLDEGRLAASLSHPHIVQVLDVLRDEQGPFIVMEYLQGETLAYLQKVHHAGKRMPLPVLCRVFCDVARALHYAHTAMDPAGAPRGIVHRDVSPTNLIVCFNGHTKLVDFGVAKAAENTWKTQAGTVKGKLRYLAPEQVTGAAVDGRVDLFQLGIVLHEAITGRPLFEAMDLVGAIKAVQHQRIPPPSELIADVPPALEAVVMKALSREPDQRFSSGEELACALERVARAKGGLASAPEVARWLREVLGERIARRDQVEREVLLGVKEPAQSVPPPLFDSGERRRPPPQPPHVPPVLHPLPAVARAQPIPSAVPHGSNLAARAMPRPPPLPPREDAMKARSARLPEVESGVFLIPPPRPWLTALVSATASGVATALGVLLLVFFWLRAHPDQLTALQGSPSASSGQAIPTAVQDAAPVLEVPAAEKQESPQKPTRRGSKSAPQKEVKESSSARLPLPRPVVDPLLVPAAKFSDEGGGRMRVGSDRTHDGRAMNSPAW